MITNFVLSNWSRTVNMLISTDANWILEYGSRIANAILGIRYHIRAIPLATQPICMRVL